MNKRIRYFGYRMLSKIQHIADKIVQRYFLPFSLTMLIHLLFFAILVVLEMAKPEKPAENFIFIDLQTDEEPITQNTETEKNEGNDNSTEIKNVEKNLAEKSVSETDYYREAKELIKSAQPREMFKANDYKDLRWLIKDYSLETPDIQNWDKPDDNINQNEANKSATYAGNAIISYDLGGRKATRLPIPAYKCFGQGKVTIEIIVNPKGQVISARILEASAAINETCLPQSALEAAQRSRFQPNDKAATHQKGYIYYTFIAQ
ncbi:MAG: TonB family protein [Bacteroidales bacterium]|nr:TonB family protein [Bacteroidales bacterium]